ncbi:UNVERIFIED_CONTAM: LINE-1 reverse transcriptase [Sesamum latifolium]|uniref:LINE-1 reverse transcriptase n=1 Tax=Sesamum latifolium TaxID=2727402 RepID=A0AAW2XQX5_9LAMI
MEEVIEGAWLFQGQPIVLQRWELGMALRKLKHTQPKRNPVSVYVPRPPVEKPILAPAIPNPSVPEQAKPQSCSSMIPLAVWNVRGLNRRDHQMVVRDLVSEFHIYFIGLLETRVAAPNYSRVQSSLMTNWKWFADPTGPGNRIWLAWDESEVHVGDDPWLVLGDFNIILDLSEVCGTSGDITVAMDDFNSCLLDTGLLSIPMHGAIFTWHNCNEGPCSLWKRLDRMLANDRWLALWPNTICLSSTPRTSDHSLQVLAGYTNRRGGGMFRFDNFIARSPGFLELVDGIWRHNIHGTLMYSVTRKLKLLKPLFMALRKKKGDLVANIAQAKPFLSTVQNLLLDDRHNDLLLNLERVVRLVLMKASKMEQSMLQQRAKIQWLKGGDQCTRIFFRKRRSRSLHIAYLQPWACYVPTPEDGDFLTRPILKEEVKEAVFDIAEDKTPGPDGFSSRFYKAAWPVIGDEVTRAVQDFFVTGKLLKQINSTLLSLIPKVVSPVTVSDFRPISCCNVLYKIISKIIVQRMQGFMTKLISPSQNAFVPGRRISNNILLAQELFSGADVSSVLALRGGLRVFAEWSGLEVNLNKSHIILSKSARDFKGQLLDVLGFQEGTLPLRYLGLPLFSSRLTLADCKPLLLKVDERLKGWGKVQLSFAARLQLLQSVISALNLYWAMAFILPKGVIRAIEARMRNFLWREVPTVVWLRLQGKMFVNHVMKGVGTYGRLFSVMRFIVSNG